MSQHTRAHPTGAAPRPRKSRAVGASGGHPPTDATEATDATAPQPPTPSAEELARLLRAVADEVRRDPALARRVAASMRSATTTEATATEATATEATGEDAAAEPPVGRAFRPRLVTGAPPDLGTGIPDPFALRARLGEAGLRAALGALRLGTLRAIVRAHELDPAAKLAGQNDASKLRALILRATARGTGSSKNV